MDALITTLPEETAISPIPVEMESPQPETARTVLPREMLSIERRNHSRRKHQTSVTVFLSDGSSGPVLALSAISCDISQGGMGFRCPQHLTASRIVLRFRLPEQLYTLVEADVIHSRQEENGEWFYGVAFCRLLPEDWPLSADQAARDDDSAASSL